MYILCALFPVVFYDDDLTDALFRTLYRITHNLKKSCTVFLAIEKRQVLPRSTKILHAYLYLEETPDLLEGCFMIIELVDQRLQ